MRIFIFSLLFMFVSLVQGDTRQGIAATLNNAILKVERELEDWRHELLKEVQANTKITSFTTDGCSGGMSDGWQYMARIMPLFKNKFGAKPPWETCCIEHDKTYWQGETRNGFEARLKADQSLRQCVIDFGQKYSEEYSREFKLDAKIIQTNFTITAELMYRAVRVGGQPCTVFAWRWGYGWPHCQNNNENEQK